MLDYTNSDHEQDRQAFIATFVYVGCGLALALFIIGSLGKRLLCRLVPCMSLDLPSLATRIGILLMQAFSIACATVLVLN